MLLSRLQQRSESIIMSNLSNILTKTFISDYDSQYEFSGRRSMSSLIAAVLSLPS